MLPLVVAVFPFVQRRAGFRRAATRSGKFPPTFIKHSRALDLQIEQAWAVLRGDETRVGMTRGDRQHVAAPLRSAVIVATVVPKLYGVYFVDVETARPGKAVSSIGSPHAATAASPGTAGFLRQHLCAQQATMGRAHDVA